MSCESLPREALPLLLIQPQATVSHSIYLPGTNRRASGVCIVHLKGDTGWALFNLPSDLLAGWPILWDYILALAEPVHGAAGTHSTAPLASQLWGGAAVFQRLGTAAVLEDPRKLLPLCLGHCSRDSVGSVKPWHVVPLSGTSTTSSHTAQDERPVASSSRSWEQRGASAAAAAQGPGQGPCLGKRAVLWEPWEQLGSWKAPARAGD